MSDVVAQGAAPQGAQAVLPATPSTPEVPKQESVTPPAPEPQSAKFDALARREKLAMQKIRMARQKEAEIAKREADLQAQSEKYDKLRQSKNPEQWLQEGGFSYDDLIQFKINGGKVTPEMEIKALRQDLENKQKQDEESRQRQTEEQTAQQQRDYAETIAEFQAEIHDFLNQTPDDYELTLLYNQEHLVYETIQQHYANSRKAYEEAMQNGENPKPPRVMNKKEAADLVEKYVEGLMDKAKGTKRWQKKYGAPAEVPATDVPPGASAASSRTLSNSLSGPAMPSTGATTTRAEEDAFRRALSKL